MRAFVPRVHAVQLLIALVNHQYRAFDTRRQVRTGDDHRNFNQSFSLRVQSGHFAVDPDQIQF
jgi:hypothetical protein